MAEPRTALTVLLASPLAGLALLCAPLAVANAAGAAGDPFILIEGAPNEAVLDQIKALLPSNSIAPDGIFDARRRLDAAARSAKRTLEALGYYAAEIDTRIDEQPLALTLVLTPGPLYVIDVTAVGFDGAPPIAEAVDQVRAATKLDKGAPATGKTVVEAEAAGLKVLRALGYADARITNRDALADDASASLAVMFRYDSGPRILLGAIVLDPDTKASPAYVDRLKTWEDGDVYTPDKLEDFARRLANTGAFDAAAPRLEVAPIDPEAPAVSPTSPTQETRPVFVRLTTRRPRTISLGASYSTSEGGGVEAEWTRRNLFAEAIEMRLRGQIATREQDFSLKLRAPHAVRPGLTASFLTRASHDETDGYDQIGIGLQMALETRLDLPVSWSVGADLGTQSLRDNITNLRRNFHVLGASGLLRRDATDDLLDPTRGYRVEGRLEPVLAVGDEKSVFVRTSVQASGYVHPPKNDRLVLALRARVGSILGAPTASIPTDRLYFGGGGGSVRGFEFQSLSPRNASGALIGGRSLVDGSMEVRWRGKGRLGAAVFADVGGAASSSKPNLDDVRMSYGVGLRYFTNFGPLRADIAAPMNPRRGEPDFQLYISIGQSF